MRGTDLSECDRQNARGRRQNFLLLKILRPCVLDARIMVQAANQAENCNKKIWWENEISSWRIESLTIKAMPQHSSILMGLKIRSIIRYTLRNRFQWP